MVEASNAEHRVRQYRRAQLHTISILLCCLLLWSRALQGLDCTTGPWSSVTHSWREKREAGKSSGAVPQGTQAREKQQW